MPLRLPLFVLLVSLPCFAQNLRVVTVPWVATDPSIPHQAYNGHATTFKAIARGGTGTYLFEWDFQGDGVYDFQATTTNRYNLSTRFTYPNQGVTTAFNARVRVTSGGQSVTGVYPVRVFADVPLNPANANARQLQIMRNVAIDDGLWFLHNQLSRSGNEDDPTTGAQASAQLPSGGPPSLGSASYLEALGRNGHYAAFPAAYIGTVPDPSGNTQRFRDDPYAEDAMRLVNGLLQQVTSVTVPAADEVNTTGFYPEVTAAPILGSDDGIGLFASFDQNISVAGGLLRALSVGQLTGYIAQVGDFNRVLGRPFELIVQQLVDGLVFAQNESGVVGSWYYTPNAGVDLLGEYLGGSLDAMTGLWTAEQFMGRHGVIVPNLAKARLAQYILANSNTCPQGGTGGSFSTSANGVCDFALSAAHVFALGWVGANGFATNDSRLAFPGYNAVTRGQLRSQFNSSLVFITNVFLSTSAGQNNWDTGFVEGGNFGRVDGAGNHWSMLQWARASRAVEPQIVNYGSNDWERLFARYLVLNQAATGDWNWAFNATQPHSDDNVGFAGRTGWALLTLSPDSQAPVPIGVVSVATAPEGTPIDFTGRSTTSTTSEFLWSFGNGATANGANVTYAYPDNGMFNATLTESTGSQVQNDTVQLTITNVAPVADAGVDLTLDEGTAAALAGTFTDPGTADTWTFQWSFGDATTANAQNVNHTWGDNGVFNVTFRVTDDDGATSVDARVVTVNNVAPTITSTPSSVAQEAQQYTYTLTFTDPGTADTHACSAPVRPAGSALVGCQFVWTPDFSQSIGGAPPVRLCVTDDDGGQTCQDFTVNVTFLDSDGDGLPDSWEISNFGNVAASDQLGDPDADGLNNLQEFTAVTDPLTYDGPNAPSPTAPACGTKVTEARPTLSVTNAVDPQATALTYDFEVYEDVALTRRADGVTALPAGPVTTSWRVTVPLAENARYFWRARAHDQSVAGPWTMPTCDFTVDAVDELPTAPRISVPAIGARVSSLTPVLTVDDAVDPEGDPLTYDFEVFEGSMMVASMAMVPSGSGSTSWTVTTALTEDTEYTWRARAVSAGGAGPYSALGRFFVNLANSAPPAPVLIAPQNGTVVESLTPELAFLPVTDPDLDPVVYDWEAAADETFSAALASGMDGTATRVTVSPALTEDSRVCWRVRADDGLSTSEWVRACFTVTATEGGPNVPTTINPSNGSEVATLAPVFSWAVALDPEGDDVVYDLEVKQGDAVAGTARVEGTTAVLAAPLEDGKAYSWRVRAVATRGPPSDYSEPSTFTVKLPVTPPPETTPPEMAPPPKCGCDAAPAGVLLGVAAMTLFRRRRR